MQINTKTSRKRRLFRGAGGAPFPPNHTTPTALAVGSIPFANAAYVAVPNAYASGVATAAPPGYTSHIPVAAAKYTASAVATATTPTAHYSVATATTPTAHYFNASATNSAFPPSSAAAWHWQEDNGSWVPYDTKCSGLIESVRRVSELSSKAMQ